MRGVGWMAVVVAVLVGCGDGTTAPPSETDAPEPEGPTYINLIGSAYVSGVDGDPLPREFWSQDCPDGASRDDRNRTLEGVTFEFLGEHSDPSVRDRFTGASLTTQRECDGIIVESRATFEGQFLATKDSLWLWWDDSARLGMEAGAWKTEAGAWIFEGTFNGEPALVTVVLGSVI